MTATDIEHIKRELENAHALINILSIVAHDDSLENILNQAVEELLRVSWLSLLPTGGVFVVNNQTQTLKLIAKKNLTPILHSLCDNIPFGHCLCGRAAATKEVQYAKCVDERHDITFDEMAPHGHYNIPLCLGENLLGVLVVYLSHGHEKNDIEIEFLSNVGKTLSLLIQVKNKEIALNNSQTELQAYLSDLDLKNSALQKQAEHMVALSEEQHELRSKAEFLEQKALHASRHDALTYLPNRNYFTLLCQKSLLTPLEENRRNIVLFIDIDGFKAINDTLGHSAGDELLIQISDRLKNIINEKDIAARFGGDEFVIFMHDLPSITQGEINAQNIVTCLSAPYTLNAGTAKIGASCGVSVFPNHGKKIETLIDVADQAMYKIKSDGKNGVFVAPL